MGAPQTMALKGGFYRTKNTLQLNGLDPNEFAAAIRNFIKKGCGKHRNIILVGNSNYGRKFPSETLDKDMSVFYQSNKWNI